jgi:hypothetical protein
MNATYSPHEGVAGFRRARVWVIDGPYSASLEERATAHGAESCPLPEPRHGWPHRCDALARAGAVLDSLKGTTP